MKNLMNMMSLLVSAMVGIAFFTLMERKYMSYSQNRKGPVKVSMWGIMQPISDAIKLMAKELNMNLKANSMAFMLSPLINIVCAIMMWMVVPNLYTFNFMKMGVMFMIACSGMNTLVIMTMSWSSNSNYSFIGMMRTMAQMISYEVNFMLVLMLVMNMTEQMNFTSMEKIQKYSPTMLLLLPAVVMWMIIVLAETNRTPFDFSEGESELISGYNIEYSSNSFMLMFLAEYSSILLISVITTVMFITSMKSMMLFLITYLVVTTMFIWTRVTLPRFRYDKLMKLNWKQMLPATTFMLMMSFMMKSYSTKKVKAIVKPENKFS